MRRQTLFFLLFCAVCGSPAAESLFRDDFLGPLGSGWAWVREDPKAWRATSSGLEIRVLPGNMWGPANNAKNVLVRPAPHPDQGQVEVMVTVRNEPTEQYEQIDLVWYYNDSYMVKVGQELVDGQRSLVMGREEQDKTRTIAIIPITAATVQLRFLVQADQITGFYKTSENTDWQRAGACELPAAGSPRVSLQAYQGPRDKEHWARLTDFRVVQNKE